MREAGEPRGELGRPRVERWAKTAGVARPRAYAAPGTALGVGGGGGGGVDGGGMSDGVGGGVSLGLGGGVSDGLGVGGGSVGLGDGGSASVVGAGEVTGSGSTWSSAGSAGDPDSVVPTLGAGLGVPAVPPVTGASGSAAFGRGTTISASITSGSCRTSVRFRYAARTPRSESDATKPINSPGTATSIAPNHTRGVRGAGLRTRYAHANANPRPAVMNNAFARSASPLPCTPRYYRPLGRVFQAGCVNEQQPTSAGVRAMTRPRRPRRGVRSRNPELTAR